MKLVLSPNRPEMTLYRRIIDSAVLWCSKILNMIRFVGTSKYSALHKLLDIAHYLLCIFNWNYICKQYWSKSAKHSVGPDLWSIWLEIHIKYVAKIEITNNQWVPIRRWKDVARYTHCQGAFAGDCTKFDDTQWCWRYWQYRLQRWKLATHLNNGKWLNCWLASII